MNEHHRGKKGAETRRSLPTQKPPPRCWNWTGGTPITFSLLIMWERMRKLTSPVFVVHCQTIWNTAWLLHSVWNTDFMFWILRLPNCYHYFCPSTAPAAHVYILEVQLGYWYEPSESSNKRSIQETQLKWSKCCSLLDFILPFWFQYQNVL